MKTKLSLTIASLLAIPLSVLAEESTHILDTVVVTDKKPESKSSPETEIKSNEIRQRQAQIHDTAKLLEDVPGISLQAGGGVSSLPIIHGLNDDRVKVEVNGMSITSACANHMNPPLSYIDPANVAKITILKGVTPVSMGGDSIGGTISVQSVDPVFAKAGEAYLLNGRLSGFYKSNGDVFGGAVTVGAANQFAKFEYTGSYSQAALNYKDGDGDAIGSTQYTSQNHAISLAFNHDNHFLEIKGGLQHIPYQGFPTQRMDMTNNDSIFGNVHYKGVFNWGDFDAKVYLENTNHAMDIVGDKLNSLLLPPYSVKPSQLSSWQMPMNTSGRNVGYKLQAELPFGEKHLARIGNEFVSNRINDWWSPVTGAAPWMGPDNFVNLNKSTKDRIGTYAEVESKWTQELSSLLGVRYDHTMTSAGNTQGYSPDSSGVYEVAGFNNAARKRNFDSVDVTSSLHFTANKMSQFEIGYAMKNRAPSIYELYPWSNNSMIMTMIGSFGDGNAYIGNVNLKKETAHNLSLTAAFQDPDKSAWAFKTTPYFSYVDNFIDVNPTPASWGAMDTTPAAMIANMAADSGFNFLQYANHNAILYGIDVSGRADLYKNDTLGQFATHANMSYVRGKRTDGNNLYHIMPFNMKLNLDHQLGNWNSTIGMQFVDSKTDVQTLRGELKTPSYVLLNLKSSYKWNKLTINTGIDNLLNKQYYSPTGGSYMGNYYAMDISMANGVNANLPAPGRSVFVGMTLEY